MELLECPACNRTFNAPITLKCGHTFCKGCLSSKRQKACKICRLRYRITPNINICLHHIVELAGQLGKKYAFNADYMTFEPLDVLPVDTASNKDIVDVYEERANSATSEKDVQSPLTFDALLPDAFNKDTQEAEVRPRPSIANEIIKSYHRTSRISRNADDSVEEDSSASPPSQNQPAPTSRLAQQVKKQDQKPGTHHKDQGQHVVTVPLRSARKQESLAEWPRRDKQRGERSRNSVRWAPDVVDNSPKLAHRIPKDVGIGANVWRLSPSPPDVDSSSPETPQASEFHPGDTVRVRAECSEFGREWSGQTGVVRAINGGTVTISLNTAIWTCRTVDIERVEESAEARGPISRFRGVFDGDAMRGRTMARAFAGST